MNISEDTTRQAIYRKTEIVTDSTQTFPHTDIHVEQEAVTIKTWLSPSRYDTYILTADLMDALCRQWVMTHEALKNELIQSVKQEQAE